MKLTQVKTNASLFTKLVMCVLNLPTASHTLICENWCLYLCLVPRPHPAFHRFLFNFLFARRDSLGIRLCIAVLIALENIDKQDVEKQTLTGLQHFSVLLEVRAVAMIHSGSVLFPYPPLILWHSTLLVSYPDCVHSLGTG